MGSGQRVQSASPQSTKQLRQTDLQNVGDLPDCIHGDIDPAAFQQAHVGAMQVAGFRKALLREPPRRNVEESLDLLLSLNLAWL